jgi:DNA-binding response OmpR family regulator
MFIAVFPSTPTPALTAALIDAGYRPVPVGNVGELTKRAPPEGWAAAVVELGDDAAHGAIVAGKIHEEHEIPVLVVADRLHTDDLEGERGFADFLLSPIDRAELRIRLGRLVASPEGPAAEPTDDVVRYMDLELNTATYQATVHGSPCDLTYMEYELLRFFVENQGRVWSREQILSKVWGYDYFGGSRTVDVHVRRLRAKLGEERSSWITTVRSVGYRFG